ncbi:DUF1998 domain-containing protein, partial [bacterium]|nr:DUF1998 domain-containing protein [candidate division CSSED10-310 bacterium]
PAMTRTLFALYDGDTSQTKRLNLRRHPPSILITNPDIIHYSILPYHTRWKEFLEHISLIVIDEIHTYRGVFGSHILQVFRRLKRILSHYEASPLWIACSATIGNPEELAENLFEMPFHCVRDSGAPSREKGFLSYFPEDSATTSAVKIFESCIKHGLKTIVFTKSRRQTELIFRYLNQRNPLLTQRTAVYRAGFLPSERRQIEARLFDNTLDGVISTSALELGIDIGGLDCCVLVGFPGSVASLWQRAGRVGRSQNPSLVIYIVGSDALDKYWFDHEPELLKAPVEKVVVYNTNNRITDQHLECAADELPLIPQKNYPNNDHIADRISMLTETNVLLESAEGSTYLSRSSQPQRRISLRSMGENYKIYDDHGKIIGDIDGIRVYKECHKGAVYLHGGQVFQVTHLDMKNYKVVVEPGPEDIYTQAISEKETEILAIDGSISLPNATLHWGQLKVHERVTGYKVKRIFTAETITTHPLEFPEKVFETRGLWLAFHSHIEQEIDRSGFHPMGGFHALEHALIGLYPLISICDRSDLAGISTCLHPQTASAAVFIYDGFPGGLGLAESALPRFDELLRSTLNLILTCPCETGCPMCIQSPKCGSGNEPLDKNAVLFILKSLLEIPSKNNEKTTQQKLMLPCEPEVNVKKHEKEITDSDFEIPTLPSETECPSGTVLVFDLETQRSSDDVGGWHRAEKMGLAIGVIYDVSLNRYEYYLEKDVDRLIKRLSAAKCVVGFNIDRFDLQVLSGYTPTGMPSIYTLDILKVVESVLGHRISLNQLAEVTLNIKKSADGLQSLVWWKSGEISKIAAYCRDDVEITYKIYEYGLRSKHLLYRHRSGMKAKIPINWS